MASSRSVPSRWLAVASRRAASTTTSEVAEAVRPARVPPPVRVSSIASAWSALFAFAMGPGATSRSLASCLTDGSRSPAASCPVVISPLI